MLDKEYEALVQHLEEMISDGVQLVHGGNLLSWEDTNIPDLLREINRKKQEIAGLTYASGELLQNRYTGQKVAVIRDDGNAVYLNPVEKVMIYPKDKVGCHFTKSQPSD